METRYAKLDAKGDPLVTLNTLVPWGDFRPRLEAVLRRPSADRKSRAGRRPWDAVVMFEAIVLSALCNLSDEQLEQQLRDRLSFMRFLGLGLEDPTPDATTIRLYREQLVRAGLVDELFGAFDAHLKAQGRLAMGGQMIDASIVPVPKQRNPEAYLADILGRVRTHDPKHLDELLPWTSRSVREATPKAA